MRGRVRRAGRGVEVSGEGQHHLPAGDSDAGRGRNNELGPERSGRFQRNGLDLEWFGLGKEGVAWDTAKTLDMEV